MHSKPAREVSRLSRRVSAAVMRESSTDVTQKMFHYLTFPGIVNGFRRIHSGVPAKNLVQGRPWLLLHVETSRSFVWQVSTETGEVFSLKKKKTKIKFANSARMGKSRHISSSRSRSSSYHRQDDRRRRHRRDSRSRRSCECSRCQTKSRSPRTPSCHPRTRFYGSRENPYKSRVLGVFGLSQASNEAKLMQVFSPFGAVEHISLIYDANTGNSRGFGFIYFAKIHEAEVARKTMNGETIDGRRVRVDFSITKRAHTPTPGEKVGSFRENFHVTATFCIVAILTLSLLAGIYMGHKHERSRRRSRSNSRSHSRSRRSRRYGRSSRRSRSYSR